MKAVALFSGGLDSALAAKVVAEEGIKVTALHFKTPFCDSERYAVKTAKALGIPLKIIKTGADYIQIIRKPKHSYGSAMNPCVDCKIFMIKKAKAFAKKIGAKFIFTGEVLGQRPMSQNLSALHLIERETGLKGKLLRPLSAKLLPETEAEKKGWIDRNKLLAISGRQRKEQLELARKYNIKGYSCPSGGCLLTQKEFAAKLRDLFRHKQRIAAQDIELLKIGRHFRFGKSKIIVGRNEAENKALLKMKGKADYFFEAADNIPGPITLLQGAKTKRAIKLAGGLTVRYSDAKQGKIKVNYGREKLSRSMVVAALQDKEIEKLRI